MSSLGFCSLDEAYNKSNTFKKKSKKLKNVDRILERGSEIDMGGRLLRNSTNTEEVNKIPLTYNNNNEYVKLKEKVDLMEQHNRDKKPNEWQNRENENSKKFFEDIQTQIFKLTQEVKELKDYKPTDEKYVQDNKIEGYVNYNIDKNLLPKRNITFDNDQFNELLLYIFTGIFLLILIDYIYKLGQKSF